MGWVILAGALVVGAHLRWRVAVTRPVYDDELWSLMLSSGRGSVHLEVPEGEMQARVPEMTGTGGAPGWTKVYGRLEDVTHPPGYYVALGVWRRLFGGSDLTARMLSVCCGAGFLVMAFLGVSRVLSVEAGLWTAWTLAVARPFVELCAEARPYAFELFWWSVAFWGVARLVRRRGADGVEVEAPLDVPALGCLAVGTLGLCASHYFACGAVLMAGVSCAALLRGRSRRAGLACVVVPACVFWLAWFPEFSAQLRNGRFSLADSTTLFLARPGGSVLDPVVEVLRSLSAFLCAEPTTGWIAGLVLAGAALGWRFWRGWRRAIGLLLLSYAGGCLAPLGLDVVRHSAHTYVDRYLILTFAPCVALASWGVVASTRHWAGGVAARALPAGLLALALYSRSDRFDVAYADFSGVVARLEPLLAGGTVLISAADGDFPYPARKQLLVISHFAKSRDFPVVIASGPLPTGTLEKLRHLRCVILAKPGTRMALTLLPEHRLTGRIPIDSLHELWLEAPAGTVER